MKKQFMVIALCALMCMVAGCKSDPQKDPTNPDTPVTRQYRLKHLKATSLVLLGLHPLIMTTPRL